MIKNFVKILGLLGDRLEVCVSVCSEYNNTNEVAYCVPYLHNMLQL